MTAVRFVRAEHPMSDSLPADHGLTAYDVVSADGKTIGQVWQVHSVHYGRPESTGFKAIHTVEWTYTTAPYGEELARRSEAASSLVRAATWMAATS